MQRLHLLSQLERDLDILKQFLFLTDKMIMMKCAVEDDDD